MKPFDVDACRTACANSIRNTPTGKWLDAACKEVVRLRGENKRLCRAFDRLVLSKRKDGEA